jgi:uncharacterized protein GlcG (DUF336 family)
MDLATQAAQAAVADCRQQGYQVTAIVVDRNAIRQVLLRDDLAARFTMDLAEGKANAVILAGVSSAELRRNRADIRDELNQTAGLLVLAGGVPIRAAGSLVAAIGVSGAPGGELDEACALAGVEAIEEALAFAE